MWITRKSTLTKWLALTALVLLATWVGGCEEAARQLEQRCERVESDYRDELGEETTELDDVERDADDASGDSSSDQNGDSEVPAQFGLTMSNSLLSDIVTRVVQPVLKSALKAASTVRVAGQNVQLSADGDILELQFESDPACDHCFGVTGELDGSIRAEIPALGERRANLGGSVRIVAPLLLEPGDEKAAAIKLDLAELASVGSSSLTARIDGLSDEWAQRLRGPVSDLLHQQLEEELEPVTLVEFEGPNFGIDGFQLTPVRWQTDSDHASVFAGFSTNIAALNVPGADGISSVTRLADDQNIALSFQPKLVVHALSLLITGGEVSRTYTFGGDASEDGGLHVTLSDFLVGGEATTSGDSRIEGGGAGQRSMALSGDAGRPDDAGDAGDVGPGRDAGTGGGLEPDLPMALDFSIHQFQQGGFCFSATAEAAGGLSVRDNNLRMVLNDVHFTSSSVPKGLIDIANWKTAEFVRESRTLVEKSLDRDSMEVPGSTLSLGPIAVELTANTVVLRGHSEVQDGEQE